MFVLSIRELLLQKGKKPIITELRKCGIGRNAAKHYLSGKAKSIKLDDLFQLCLFYNCTPKEVMRVSLDQPKEVESHPLFDWSQPFEIFPLEDLLELTPAQMAKAQEALRQIKNEGKQEG